MLFYYGQQIQFDFMKSVAGLESLESEKNYHYIFWPNYTLILQTLFAVSYITELNRILIWFETKEKGTITKFYEETVQDKIPVVLVSNDVAGHQNYSKR